MKLYKQYPIASDRMGMLWALNGIDDACIIEFGPAGTTHFSIEGLMQFGADIKAKTFTTHLDEHDVTFGDEDRIIEAIKEVDEIEKPKYIFVLGSSITSIIGIDLESVKYQIQEQVNAKIIILPDCDFKSDYRKGVEDTLLLLVKEIVEKQIVKEKEHYFNLIGIGIHDFNFSSDLCEIKRIMMKYFNLKLNTTFMLHTNIKEIEDATKACINIVIRKEGLKAAQELKEKYNQPYIYIAPYGVKATSKMIDEVSSVINIEPNKCIDKDIDELIYKENVLKRRINALPCKTIKIKSNDSVNKFIEQYLLELGFIIGKNEREHIIIFSNGIDLLNNDKVIQIDNPSFNQDSSYPYTPYMGYRGTHYLLQIINNKITKSRFKI